LSQMSLVADFIFQLRCTLPFQHCLHNPMSTYYP